MLSIFSDLQMLTGSYVVLDLWAKHGDCADGFVSALASPRSVGTILNSGVSYINYLFMHIPVLEMQSMS